MVGCNCCKHASSLDNHSCRRLIAQTLKRRKGDVWPKGVLPGTCLKKPCQQRTSIRHPMLRYTLTCFLPELARFVTLHVRAQRVLGIFPAAQSFLHRAIGHGLMQDWKDVELLSCYPEEPNKDGLIQRERLRIQNMEFAGMSYVATGKQIFKEIIQKHLKNAESACCCDNCIILTCANRTFHNFSVRCLIMFYTFH